MTKITRTANLIVLQAAMIGGQNDDMGNWLEADQSFTADLTAKELEDNIRFYIEEYGNNVVNYYHQAYKLKMPSDHNMAILVKRIAAELALQALDE